LTSDTKTAPAARDGHVRLLPRIVADQIAAGEVVERPASVVKELVENSLDAGARRIDIAITQGGRKLISVRDDGCGMIKEDALLSLERQATSKIRDVHDIEAIDTLGFRGEAVPSIASVSRFTITTRTPDSDEGTRLQVNGGTLVEIAAAGCPVGTTIEVRDLFCNVPARRNFLRAYETEAGHVKKVFTSHALAHPDVGFSLSIDGRELYRLAPASNLRDRVRDLFGDDFLAQTLTVGESAEPEGDIRVSGLLERPNLANPSRRDQYIFVNGRPASAPSINATLRDAYPRHAGDVRPAAILFIDLPPRQVDVNVHPTKREVRFRNNLDVKRALEKAIAAALGSPNTTALDASQSSASPQVPATGLTSPSSQVPQAPHDPRVAPTPDTTFPSTSSTPSPSSPSPASSNSSTSSFFHPSSPSPSSSFPLPSSFSSSPSPVVRLATSVPTFVPASTPVPVQNEIAFAIEPGSDRSKPWRWFRCLAQAESGYLLVETDSGIVTINPQAARERIAYERLLDSAREDKATSQALLIPETIKLGPVDAARLSAALETISRMGFSVEAFGTDTFKIDAVPQLIGTLSARDVLTTIAHDLAEGSGTRRAGERWRDERIAKSIARSYAGASLKLTPEGARRLVEELSSCRMPYVCPRGKPVMIFTSTTELDRKFSK
jgi:DNA mismatch repair protein MutL